MAGPVGAEFLRLIHTHSTVGDIISFIHNKHIVALYTRTIHQDFHSIPLDPPEYEPSLGAVRVFHAIPLDPSEYEPSLEAVWVIYFNCDSMPHLLYDGELEYVFKKEIQNVIELDVESKLREAIIDQTLVPKKAYTSIAL